MSRRRETPPIRPSPVASGLLSWPGRSPNQRRRPMDRMLVTVFDNESKAYAGKEALKQLDAEGNIGLYGYAVISKGPDGSVNVKQGDDIGPLGTLLGTSLGSLIGVLGGPAGLAIGATAGATAG